MYLICYLIDGLLKSTLQYFYDVTCLEELQVYISSEFNLAQCVLEFPSSSSRYKANSTVQQLIDILFADQWFSNISYKFY